MGKVTEAGIDAALATLDIAQWQGRADKLRNDPKTRAALRNAFKPYNDDILVASARWFVENNKWEYGTNIIKELSDIGTMLYRRHHPQARIDFDKTQEARTRAKQRVADAIKRIQTEGAWGDGRYVLLPVNDDIKKMQEANPQRFRKHPSKNCWVYKRWTSDELLLHLLQNGWVQQHYKTEYATTQPINGPKSSRST